ncbi:hypothetical protein AJ79_03174 [Helicocarpus griseus UAMH5409]|uniref:Protein kinase domain-containing protein n=1 Tax=Helicocarpus griseus UAMH5409 TaxID=1447875 RepID=A0A2B7XZJ6_9EURO|nr:hypothetical protein AJ79_03174 [Helicocarpus griseus UAMH5409]
MAFLLPDNSRCLLEDHLGNGSDAIVIQRGPHALKVPKIRPTAGLGEAERRTTGCTSKIAREILEREKQVYRRIGKCNGVAECVEIVDEGIVLACYKNVDLERYVEREKEVESFVKTAWILSAIAALRHLHHVSKVLVFDIAPRNFMLADDMLALKMIDFGQASIFPLDTDNTTVNDEGLTASVDVFHLGCTIYSIVSWQSFEQNLANSDWAVPPLEDMPKLDDLGTWGQIIRKCWTCQYHSAEGLYQEARELYPPLASSGSLFPNGWISAAFTFFTTISGLG